MYQHFIYEINQIPNTIERFENNRIVKNDTRFTIYQSTYKIIIDNMFLGVGPGNWKIIFPNYGLKNSIWEEGDKYVKSPHSDFLLFFSESGFFGGLSYLVFFILMLYYSFILFIKYKSKNKYFFLIIFSTLCAYSFISLVDFPFENPTHNLFLSIYASILISEKKSYTFFSNRTNKLIHIFLFSFLFSFFIYSILRLNCEIKLRKAMGYKMNKNWNMMLKELDFNWYSFVYEIDNTTTPIDFYRGMSHINMNNLNSAFTYYKMAYKIHPFHIHIINSLAKCYELRNDISSAKEYYKKCLRITPAFEDPLLSLSAIYFSESNYDKTLDLLLDFQNIQLFKQSSFSDNYKNYFLTSLIKINMNNFNSIKFEKINSYSNNEFYEFLKNIYFMRNEKKTYLEINKLIFSD